MLEVELKAIVSDERQVEKELMKLKPEKVETVSYNDVYFDSKYKRDTPPFFKDLTTGN